MKTIFTFLIFSHFLFQQAVAQVVKQLRKTYELKMPSGGGNNGGTISQHGKNRYYYATIVGNKTYSFAYFNAIGEIMSSPDLAVLADVRGIWYNPNLKTFQGNLFGDAGWVIYQLDDAGVPYDVRSFLRGQLQPYPNSVGQYNARENLVHFLKGSTVVSYNAANGEEDKTKVFLLKTGYSKKISPPDSYKIDSNSVLNNYNTTTVIYTGIMNAEFGLLNVQTKEIELYSKADGFLTQRLKLPVDTKVKNVFNFGYSSGTYFLYDSGKRSWIGYK